LCCENTHREREREREMDRDRHVQYLLMMYESIPSDYEEQEINRLTLAYFVISGLNILNALDRIDKEQVVNWVLSFQVHPSDSDSKDSRKFYGFYGSTTIQFSSELFDTTKLSHNGGHLASTYCALAMLKTVGYDLCKLDSELILISMKNLQQHNGSFMPIHAGAEKDLRFVYCAAAICFMLNSWCGMDREKAKEYILSCQVCLLFYHFKKTFSVTNYITKLTNLRIISIEDLPILLHRA
ncbi:hypothetical protein AQUCO_00300017v1, partial [Aquilegia coerulea]